MGGQVIELECIKQWNARLAEGNVLVYADMGLSRGEIARKVGITEEEVNKILKSH